MSATAPPPTTCWRSPGPTAATPALVEVCLVTLALVPAIVDRGDDMRGFVVLPRRWIGERLFDHLVRARRLARDFERAPPVQRQ
ncbi:hypothetical protein ACFW2K_37985 [Streptomyces nigra]|uniref:hypothetical protein n=1 Tax=Streptomyces nigra TaxID=1827580 RepID=UPI0036911A2D